MRPSHWIPSTAVWSGLAFDGIPRADSRMAQGVLCSREKLLLWSEVAAWTGVQEDGEEGDAGYRVQSSQNCRRPGRAWGWVEGGMWQMAVFLSGTRVRLGAPERGSGLP